MNFKAILLPASCDAGKNRKKQKFAEKNLKIPKNPF
jgi:hypothetical protein